MSVDVQDPVALEAADPRCLSDADAAALLGGRWATIVTLGDSIAAGVGADHGPYRPIAWAERLALALPGARHVNLGVRDLRAHEIRATQLEPALAEGPDLAVLAAGGNDVLRPELDLDAVEAELDATVGALRAAGADVLTLGLFDASGSSYVPEPFRAPLAARLDGLARRTAAVAARHGAAHADCTSHPASADPAIYHPDGLHCTNVGHAIATAVAVRALSAAAPASPGPGAPRPAR